MLTTVGKIDMIKKIAVPIDSGIEDKAVSEIKSTFARTEKKITDVISSKTWPESELDNIKSVIIKEMQKILKSLPCESHEVKIVKKRVKESDLVVETPNDYAKEQIMLAHNGGDTPKEISDLLGFNVPTIRSVIKASKLKK